MSEWARGSGASDHKSCKAHKNAGVIGIPAEHKETCKAYQIAAGAVEEIREKKWSRFHFS